MTTLPSTFTAVTGRSAALAGIGFMLVAVFLFALNSAAGKWLVANYPVGEFMLIRSAFTLLFLSPFIWRAGRAAFADIPKPGAQVLGVVLSAVEVAMFFWAVSYLPLADAVTFYLAGPIYVTALSVLLLGETVRWRRWSAVLIGFLGVVVAMWPSSASFTVPALIALGGSIVFALVMIVTRLLRETSNTVLVTGQIAGTLIYGMAAAPFGWMTPSPFDVVLLVLFGVTAMIALACINHSLKLAPASVVVPYQYTLIIWAILLG